MYQQLGSAVNAQAVSNCRSWSIGGIVSRVNHDPDTLILDADSLAVAVETLRERSPTIDRIVTQYGMPHAWMRRPDFAALVYAILEQQVSLASARAVYERLVALAGTLTPEAFQSIDDQQLRSIGFSWQKVGYCRGLAEEILQGTLRLPELQFKGDDEVREALTAIKGIGPWTADVYLLHSLGRPDVWPVGDLALQVAVQEELDLEARPTQGELLELGEEYRPLRSIAARVFWQGYLVRRGIHQVS